MEVSPVETADPSEGKTRRSSPRDWSVAGSISEQLDVINELVGKLNEWEAEYGRVLQQLADAHQAGDDAKVARIESVLQHLSFMSQATRARIELVNATQVIWPTFFAERADAQRLQLGRATWALAAATIGLMVATVALIVVTAGLGA
jgi:hypothetical protein